MKTFSILFEQLTYGNFVLFYYKDVIYYRIPVCFDKSGVFNLFRHSLFALYTINYICEITSFDH
jgi:hypothetical protein